MIQIFTGIALVTAKYFCQIGGQKTARRNKKTTEEIYAKLWGKAEKFGTFCILDQ